MSIAFHSAFAVSLFFGHIQAWAAREFRATKAWHEIPWAMFVLIVWVLTRPVFHMCFALARWIDKRGKAVSYAVIAARLKED